MFYTKHDVYILLNILHACKSHDICHILSGLKYEKEKKRKE